MKTILKHTLLSLVLLAGAFSVQAQVKVGTNPTSIGANNNLEVEGSIAGRKFTVDKASGKITIADGTEGDGKVLTSDAIGGASWQSPSGLFLVNSVGSGGQVYVADNVNAYTGSSITFPKAGKYVVHASWAQSWAGGVGNSNGHGFVNTILAKSPTQMDFTGIASQWVYVIHGANNSTPGFQVTTDTDNQTLYFWLWGGYMTNYITMGAAFAIGPFAPAP